MVQNPCDPNPCQNEAECRSWGAVRRQCICRPGYTGVNCSENIGKDYISTNFRHNLLFKRLKIYFPACLSLLCISYFVQYCVCRLFLVIKIDFKDA